MKTKSLKNRLGFTLVETLVTAGLASIVMVAVGVTIYNFSKSKVSMERDQTFTQYKSQLERILNSDVAYSKTLANNSAAMNCVINKVDCYNQSGEILLYDESGAVVPFVSTNSQPSRGLSPQGAICNSFSYTNAPATCPFKWVAKWTALCKSSPCLNPTVQVTVTFNYAQNAPLGSLSTSSNFVSHQFQQVASSDTEVCTSLGGVLVSQGSTTKCVRPGGTNLSSCPAGQYVVGFSSQGDVHCQSYPTMTCPTGQVVQAINPDGSVKCATGCLSGTTPKCYHRADNSKYGLQVQQLLAQGLISKSQVLGMGCKN